MDPLLVIGELLELARNYSGEISGWAVAAWLGKMLYRRIVLVRFYEQREPALLEHVRQLRESNSEFALALQRAYTANAQQAETIRSWRAVAKHEGWCDDKVKTVRFDASALEPWSPLMQQAQRVGVLDEIEIELDAHNDNDGGRKTR